MSMRDESVVAGAQKTSKVKVCFDTRVTYNTV